MRTLIDLLELFNACSPSRAGAYMFFIVLTSYLLTSTIFSGISNIVFVIAGYKKLREDKKDENAKQVL